MAPGLFVMQAIARWGNFFNQELYGSPTTLPWGIPIECAHRIADFPCDRFPFETTRFQPLFLYESISGAIGALVLIWMGYHLRKRLRPGDLLLTFFVWYGLTRFVLETLRHDNWTFFGVPTAQVVSLAFVIPAIVILMWRHRGRPIDDDPPTFPAVATWGAIGRPVDPDAIDDGFDDDEGYDKLFRTRSRPRPPRPAPTDEPSTARRGRRARTRRHPRRAGARAGPRLMTEPEPAPGPGRRRPPPGRISPEALAAARGGAVEGLEWLGRPPEARASWTYRLLRLVARFVIFVVFRFRIRTAGRQHLPDAAATSWSGPPIAAGWTRSWSCTPCRPQPRAWFLGSAPSTFTSRWRERLIHHVGGLLPVWRGGVGVEQHVASAHAVVANGAVFVQMPEGTVSGPPGRLGAVPHRLGDHRDAHRRPDRAVRDGRDRGALSRQADASRILPPTTARALAGLAADAPFPEPGSREEFALAHTMSDALAAILGPVVEADAPADGRSARRTRTDSGSG